MLGHVTSPPSYIVTRPSRKSTHALTLKVIDTIHTGRPVPTGTGEAFINVHTAVLAPKAGPTCALIVVDKILTARAVRTWFR